MSKSPRDAIEFNQESLYSILGLTLSIFLDIIDLVIPSVGQDMHDIVSRFKNT
jgi:hypothetical protein